MSTYTLEWRFCNNDRFPKDKACSYKRIKDLKIKYDFDPAISRGLFCSKATHTYCLTDIISSILVIFKRGNYLIRVPPLTTAVKKYIELYLS